jgi:hypothetical protein
MRNLRQLESYRKRDQEVLSHYGSFGDETCGVFTIPYPLTGVSLKCVASSDGGWDHISVSLPNRCPNWYEMEHIKRKFFKDDETVMQLHVPSSDHINMHPYCLHLWRPNNGQEIPRPPAEMVA